MRYFLYDICLHKIYILTVKALHCFMLFNIHYEQCVKRELKFVQTPEYCLYSLSSIICKLYLELLVNNKVTLNRTNDNLKLISIVWIIDSMSQFKFNFVQWSGN